MFRLLVARRGQWQGTLFPENFAFPKDWTSGLYDLQGNTEKITEK